MSRNNSFSPRKAAKAALGNHGFVPHTRELLESEALRTLSIHPLRILFFLELQHLHHRGKENGFLVATYDQLVAYGIGRRFIQPALNELVSHGLVEITHHGGVRKDGERDPSRYRLTYLSWKLLGPTGPQYLYLTNDWISYVKPTRPNRRANGMDQSKRQQPSRNRCGNNPNVRALH
jgi:hypothetical protein